MKAIKAQRCYISEDLPPLHILFTEEDDVIVGRCLDFSISSHGTTIDEAKEALNNSILDYIGHAVENDAIDNLFDPDLREYWELYTEPEVELQRSQFTSNLKRIKETISERKLVYV